ncbi:hypothetical protein EDB86DRAFT_2992025 [Lactarius hatsudake]|nr:hypothetical protein EDB86DRAFT_2992025 [Lactarius hatsudake]
MSLVDSLNAVRLSPRTSWRLVRCTYAALMSSLLCVCSLLASPIRFHSLIASISILTTPSSLGSSFFAVLFLTRFLPMPDSSEPLSYVLSGFH